MLAILLHAGCGASGRDTLEPAPALAESRAAQQDFRALQRRWLGAAPGERAPLERPLRDFLARHSEDDRARLARVYLAWLLVQRGELEQARGVVAPTRSGPAGSAQDFADVVEAAVLVKEGKPQEALKLLEPLQGKIVDAEERLLFGEQRVRAALAAKQHALAIDAARTWIAEAPPEDREAVKAAAADLIGRVPPKEMEASLMKLDEQAEASDPTPELDWMREELRQRLTRHALKESDTGLAARLLDNGPSALALSETGRKLARLAARGRTVPRVAGRSVGLVLSVGRPDLMRRSADVASGMSRALGLPAAAAKPESVKLFTRDDAGAADGSADGEGMRRALVELASEGAAVLVAGVDREGAAAAADFANTARIPVIVLVDPATEISGDHAFLLAPEPETDALLLAATLQGEGPMARVGPGGVGCDVKPAKAGRPRFPVQRWKRDGVTTLLLLGDPSCARDALREFRAVGGHPRAAFGLECAELIVGRAGIAAAAGEFPFAGSLPADVAKWQERTGSTPSWFATLGHDAALLAAAALASFPLERVDDEATVKKLHKKARRELATSEAKLWSTDARGFAGAQRLPRELFVVRGNAE